MTPELTNEVRTFWINYTEVNADMESSAPLVKGSVPRWVLLGRISNANDTSQNTSTAVLIYDNDKEKVCIHSTNRTHLEGNWIRKRVAPSSSGCK